jgi:hypothetical protein
VCADSIAIALAEMARTIFWSSLLVLGYFQACDSQGVSFQSISQDFCANFLGLFDSNLSCPDSPIEGVACLPRSVLCDAVPDCSDLSDEGDNAVLSALECDTRKCCVVPCEEVLVPSTRSLVPSTSLFLQC